MSYLLDDDSRMLRDSAARFFAGLDSAKAMRSARDNRDLAAAARGPWAEMVALGFAGILIPEASGGAGLSSRASIQVSEMMGRTLTSAPFLSSAIMAATAVHQGDNARLQSELLPAIAEGAILALAVEETARHDPAAIATQAQRQGDSYRITGRKTAVIDGNIADRLIVAARDAATGRLLLLLVDGRAAGVTVTARIGLDSRPVVDIALENVSAAADQLLTATQSEPLLDRILDAGRLHLAAEMLGAAQEAFDRTIDYLKTRVQFGKKIGEFQALQHRAAILFGELEIARSVVLKAAVSQSPQAISLAKARVGDIARHVAGEAVQLHGGIGVTDDFDMGFYLKRIRAAAERLGDRSFHIERYAALAGL